MKKLIFVLLSISSFRVFAFGAGFYTQFGSGGESVTQDTTNILGTVTSSQDYTTDSDWKNFGLAFDTALAKNKLINYRLTLGLETMDRTNSSVSLAGFKGAGMTHTLGFGLFRNQNMRIWLGPEFSLSYYNSFTDDSSSSRQTVTVANQVGTYSTDNVNILGLGLGLTAGANLNFANNLGLSLSTGYRRKSLVGEVRDILSIRNTTTNVTTSVTTEYQSYDSSANEFFVNFAAFYRFGDHY